MAVTSEEHVLGVLQIAASQHASQAYASAEDAVATACRWPTVDDAGESVPAPASLVWAVVLRTARNLARLTSPTGVVGVGDFGPVRITTVDRDIEEAEAQWRRMAVFGG